MSRNHQKASIWMVESPTYYHAFQPILKSLQKLDPDEMSFKKELVFLQPGSLPKFLEKDSKFDSSNVYKKIPNFREDLKKAVEDSNEDEGPIKRIRERTNILCMGLLAKKRRERALLREAEAQNKKFITIKQFLQTEHSENSIFDESQEEAVKTALQNRVGIIQGPPGTGKSFIGARMLNLLLSLSPTSRVLVLTYKNHALDEFLKHTMKFIDHNHVVRLGGRCQDEELDQISLNNYRKTNKMEIDYSSSLDEIKNEISSARFEVQHSFVNLVKLRNFSYDKIFDRFSPHQINSLLLGCNWNKMKCHLNFGKVKDKDGFQKQGRDKVTRQVVSQLLRSKEKQEKYSENFKKLQLLAFKSWLPSPAMYKKYEYDLVGDKDRITIKFFVGGIGRQPSSVDDKSNEEKSNKEKKGEDDTENNEEKSNKEKKGEDDEVEILEEENSRRSANDKFKNRNFYKTVLSINDVERDIKKIDHRITVFSCKALEEIEKICSTELLETINLWKLKTHERIQLTQLIFAMETRRSKDQLQQQLEIFQNSCKQRLEIKNQNDASILKKKKVIGATITGASINQQILSEVKPDIVIVEEAAEVLEPQLLACIGTWSKYMLLVGDHQQLRPPVETYHLRKEYKFDISMMERLISNQMGFEVLNLQNRQRPEFADLLLDIYPNLQTNIERVQMNHPAKCLSKSHFFWHHVENEIKERSVMNQEEAGRVVALACFLKQQGYEPKDITILATYRGQTALIRKQLNQRLGDCGVKVHTVDMYQGDENEFVIVSLVRSNQLNQIGFLNEMNRRCVAQSRAKRGLYFIGNSKMFSNHSTWKPLMDKLYERNCIGDKLELVCENHPNLHFIVSNADELSRKELFCQQPCTKVNTCQKHHCQKKCQPPHLHTCPVKIPFTHSVCGHQDVRYCEENEREMKCKTKVATKSKECGHEIKRICSDEDVKCTYESPVTLECGHEALKVCSEDSIACNEKCHRIRKNCQHLCVGHKCSEHCIKAREPCPTCEKLEEVVENEKIRKEKEARHHYGLRVNCLVGGLLKDKILHEEKRKVLYEELFPLGPSKAEYMDVVKQCNDGTNISNSLQIEKVERITNHNARIRWLKKSTELFEPEPTSKLKFFKSCPKNVQIVNEKGFASYYHDGLKFTRHIPSRRVDQFQLTTVYLCEVFLGKCYTKSKKVEYPGMRLDKQWLMENRYDSLYVPKQLKKFNNKAVDEFVVFELRQALPKYVIQYTNKHPKVERPVMVNVDTITFKSDFATSKKILRPKRQVHDNSMAHYAFVEAKFLRMMSRKFKRVEIQHIEFYINPRLQHQFEETHEEFKKKYCSPSAQSDIVYGFHGTKNMTNGLIDRVMNDNFALNEEGEFGTGVYFSEHPEHILHQNDNCMIMAQLIPGKTKECRMGTLMHDGGLTKEFDSHGEFMDKKQGTFKEIVIFNVDQILPCYVIYFKV